jgi:hypothetical protein
MRYQSRLADNPEYAVWIHFAAGGVIESVKTATLKVDFAFRVGDS